MSPAVASVFSRFSIHSESLNRSHAYGAYSRNSFLFIAPTVSLKNILQTTTAWYKKCKGHGLSTRPELNELMLYSWPSF